MNTQHFGKGLKYLGITLFLFISAPILLTMAYKALQAYTSGVPYVLALLFFVVSVILIVFSVYFGFKTFKVLLDAIFEKK